MKNKVIDPLVSICCITFNHESYIRQCIEGFLMQKTNFPVEIIIHDDASTDKTAEIVEDYAKKHPELITTILQKENQYSKGIAIAPIYIWPKARGKYIAICEGDDYWTDPLKLQKQVDFLEANEDFAICHHNMQVTYEENTKESHLSNSPDQKEVSTIEDLSRVNFIKTPSCVFRNGLIGKFPEWFSKCPIGDYPLHMLNARSGKIRYIPDVMGVYRVHKGGIWESKDFVYRMSTWVDTLDQMKNEFTPQINKILKETQSIDSEYLMIYYKEDPEKCSYYLNKLNENGPVVFAKVLDKKTKALDYLAGHMASLFVFLDNNSFIQKSAELRENNFHFTFDVKGIKGIKQLRFDPAENRICRVKITSITYTPTENELLEYPLAELSSNGKLDANGYFFFETLDPVIYIQLQGAMDSISIEGVRELEPIQRVDELLRSKSEIIDSKNIDLNQKNFEMSQKDAELNKKNEVINSKNTELNLKNAELNLKNVELNQKNIEISQKDEELKQKNEEISQRNKELTQILSSKSCRFTKPVRFIISIPLRIFSKTKYIITTTATIIKRNGGIWNTTKKTVRILRNEGFRKGNIHFHINYQSRNAKNHEEKIADIANNGDADRYETISDTNKTEIKRDETIFHSSGSILFVGHDAWLAGAQVLLLSLIKWFTEHTGIVVKVLLLQKDGDLLDKYKNICPVLVWKDLVNTFPAGDERKARLHDFIGKIDLIYGNTVLVPSVYDELKFLNVPYITHVHELEKSINLYASGRTVDKMHLFTDGYIAGSNPVLSNLLRNHCSEEGKIIVINDFIEKRETNFASAKKDLREKMGLVNEGLIIFGCGTGYWRKGVDLFIETALVLMQKGHSDFHFYWIGENIWDHDLPSVKFSSWNTLEQKIDDNDLRNHITFLGVKENFFDYFLAGDVFYLPSREDPFPLVCLEAAQACLPIICFEDAGGMPDFVEDDIGFVVPYEDVNEAADKIIFLNKNQDILQQYGMAARKKFLERHSVDIAAPQILSYCRKIGNLAPAVSVIVPNYNYEKYLTKRLNSILNQGFQDFEIIILDDASTDGSLEIIEKYLDHPDVSLFKNHSNSGNPFVQWHKGFLQAKGEILWFAEADDFCEPDFLQKLLPYFNNSSVALAYCDSFIVDETDGVIGDYGSYNEKLDYLHWKSSYQVTGVQEINLGLGVKKSIQNISAVLIRKSFINEEIFQDTFKFKFSGDWFFYTQIIKDKRIVFLSERLNFHRKHSQTIISKFNSDNIDLLFKETELIHNSVLDNYSIHHSFINKWDLFITEQINSFYPGISKENFNKYYPYDLVKEKIKNTVRKSENSKRLVFLTTNDYSANGGSEQLWGQAAIECKNRGHDVMVVIKKWDPEPSIIKNFYKIGIKIIFKGNDHFDHVKSFNPDLVIISIGDQDEGIDWYEYCKTKKIPYVIVNQLTKEPEYSPIRRDINEQVKKGYLGAEMVFFTCHNNHHLMEKRLNCIIPNSGIHFNPFHIDRNSFLPFPATNDTLKIAIPAAYSMVHKGQHLAIELFNLKKWRERPVQLNLYGNGNDEEALKAMVRKSGQKNVFFHAPANDLISIWRNNHAIFMPSFMEGLPIVLVGAMMYGRVPILTDIGAHREIVDDNINGFIAKKPTVEALDEALERAYLESNKWEEIGNKSRNKILSIIPEDPISDFIDKIISLAKKSKRGEKLQENIDEKTYHVKLLNPVKNERIKILHAIPNFNTGGSSRLIVDLVEHLGHKYDQEVMTFFIPTPLAYAGVELHDFSGDVSEIRFTNFIKEKKPDILHVHYWGLGDSPWYKKVFNAVKHLPCILIENINTPVAPYISDRIDHYVYVSEYAKNFATFVKGKSTVIYPGSNLTLFDRGNTPIQNDVIGMVYRLDPDKLNEDAIRVFIQVVKKRPQTKVIIVGGGDFLNLYQSQVVNEGVSSNFQFTGYVHYEKLPEYYKKMSIFVAPVWKESFGQVSPFAMSMKIPVVGYNIGGLPEILGNAELLANDMDELANIIVDLLEDKQRRIEIGETNYTRVHKYFSVEAMIAKYDQLYTKLLQNVKSKRLFNLNN